MPLFFSTAFVEWNGCSECATDFILRTIFSIVLLKFCSARACSNKNHANKPNEIDTGIEREREQERVGGKTSCDTRQTNGCACTSVHRVSSVYSVVFNILMTRSLLMRNTLNFSISHCEGTSAFR